MTLILRENEAQLMAKLRTIDTTDTLAAFEALSGCQPTHRQIMMCSAENPRTGRHDLRTVQSLPAQVQMYWKAMAAVYPSMRFPAEMLWAACDLLGHEHLKLDWPKGVLVERVLREHGQLRDFLDQTVRGMPAHPALAIFRELLGRDPTDEALLHYTKDFDHKGYSFQELRGAIASGMPTE